MQQFLGLGGEDAADDLDAGRAEAFGAADRVGVRVGDGVDDALDARGDEGLAGGPVRPVWLQGSRVTNAVRPAARVEPVETSFDSASTSA